MLRSGATEQTRKEVMDNLPFMVDIMFADHCLTISNGLVYEHGPNGALEGYVLSNAAKIEAWLNMLPWEGELNLSDVKLDGFVPSDLVGIVDAQMVLYNRSFKADPARLAFLEELLTTAEESFASACPFDGYLVVTLSDGRQLAVTPALDSCAAFRIGDAYYAYGSQFAYDDEGSYDNTELLAIFGLEYSDVAELWQMTLKEQVIEEYQDYTEVHTFEDCHEMLSEDMQKNAEVEEIIHCRTSTQVGYYVEEYLGYETSGYETKACTHGLVGGYDKRYEYLDEYWAQCTLCNYKRTFCEPRYGEWFCKMN